MSDVAASGTSVPVLLSDLPDALRRPSSTGARAWAWLDAHRRGLPLYPSWLMPASEFRLAVERLPPGHELSSLIRGARRRPHVVERAARAAERLQELPLSEPLTASLRQWWTSTVRGRCVRVAASPTCSDMSVARLAGLDREHVVHDLEGIEQSLRTLWADCFDERGLSYLRRAGHRDVAMAVVMTVLERDAQRIQLCVARDAASGVADVWLRTEKEWRVLRELEASPLSALAQQLADGLPAYRPSRLPAPDRSFRSRLRRRRPPPSVALAPGGWFEVLSSDADAVILDVEVAPAQATIDGSSQTLWATLGTSELSSALLDPLAHSLLKGFDKNVVPRIVGELGGPRRRVRPMFAEVRSRLYWNVSLLAELSRAAPGIGEGVVSNLVVGAGLPHGSGLSQRLGTLVGVPAVLGWLALAEHRLQNKHEDLHAHADEQENWLRELELGILPDASFATTLIETRGLLYDALGQLLATSAISMAAHVAVLRLVEQLRPDRVSVVPRMLAGVGELPTADWLQALEQVIDIARIAAGSERFERALASWLEAYGYWSPAIANLNMPRWRDDPEWLRKRIRYVAELPQVDLDSRLSNVRVTADRELAELESRLNFVERELLRGAVSRARSTARLRAACFDRLARSMALIRRVTRDADRRLRRLETHLEPDSAFFCRFEELVSTLSGSQTNLAARAAARRRRYVADAQVGPWPASFYGAPPPRLVPSHQGFLRGLPVYSGIAEGPALRWAEGNVPQQAVTGRVVFVGRLDVTQIPILMRATAVVAEHGHATTDACTLLRETGVVSIVGARAATAWMRDGESVRVDASRGTVERL